MAAMLDRNGADGRPIAHPGLPASETVACGVGGCPTSYTLAYGQTENRMEGSENNLEIMRRRAQEVVTASHPHPRTDDSYLWGGLKRGWLDKGAALAAGL